MSDCFLGEIRMFAGNYNPENWIICNGQQMSIQQYEALYSLIGTTYGGSGNTFAAPDLRGRLPVGQGTGIPPLSTRIIGQTGGEENHTLTVAEMTAHSHAVYASSGDATSTTPDQTMLYGKVTPNTSIGITGLYTETSVVPTTIQMDPKAVTSEGGGQSHNNCMTTTAISFIMAVLGMYPTRPN